MGYNNSELNLVQEVLMLKINSLKKIITIVAVLLPLGAILNAQPVPLLTEGFEGSFPPAGWSTSQTQGNNQWNRNDFYSRPNYTPGATGYCADNDDDANSNQSRVGNNALTSKTFDATAFQVVCLAWDVDWYPKPGLVELQAMVQVTNGSGGWVTVKSYIPGSRVTTRDSVNISAQAAGKANNQVRFVYNELSGGIKSYWYEIDDVSVWGSMPYPPPETLDLGISEILRPLDHEDPGIPFFPSCRVSNNLDTTAHATIRCVMKEMVTQNTVYDDALTNYSCTPGYTTVTGFEAFVPLANKVYTATFTVQHPDDKIPMNNSMSKNFNASQVEYEITPILMTLPNVPDQYGAFVPTADYAEKLGNQVDHPALRCRIARLEDMEQVYEDSIGVTAFMPYDTVTAEFDTAFLDTSTYVITFWATDIYVVNISNPVWVDTFNVLEGIAEAPADANTSLDITTSALFNAGVGLSYSIAKTSYVNLSVYDALGRKVETLVDARKPSGTYYISWNAADVPQGVYFVKLTAPGVALYRKVTKIK